MSLFKILKGSSTRISKETTPFHDGYAYFTPDDGGFYIDALVGSEERRIRINPEVETGETTVAIAATLLASGWSGNTQTITVAGLGADQDGVIGMAQGVSAAESAAVFEAQIRISSQGTGALTVVAEGAVPTIDIPIVIILMNDGDNVVEVNLPASGWTNRTQTVSIAGLSAEQSGVMGMVTDMTDAEYNAIQAAGLYVSGQSEGSITVSASGKIPSIDVPIAIILLD